MAANDHFGERIRVLRALELFADATDDELARIDGLMSTIDVRAGARLTVEGAGGLDCMIVAEGRASVTKGGERVTIIGPGELIGELSVLWGVPRSATVIALTPMRLLVLHLGEFAEMLRVAPSVRAKVEAIADDRSAEEATDRGHEVHRRGRG